MISDHNILVYRSFEFLECIRMHEFAEGTLLPFERSLYTLNSPCVCLFLIPSPAFQPHESLASPPVLMANTFYNSGPLRPRFFSLVLICRWPRMKSDGRSIWSTQT
ncbi:unnamed protein product [Musa hybrid cultivar]